jgi:hypothetical protein
VYLCGVDRFSKQRDKTDQRVDVGEKKGGELEGEGCRTERMRDVLTEVERVGEREEREGVAPPGK